MSDDRRRRYGWGETTSVVAGLAIGVAIAGLGGFSHRAPPVAAAAGARTSYAGLGLFGQAFETVREHYIEVPDGRNLVRSAIRGMLASLDPHSGYVDGQAARATNAFVRGEIGDTGIELAERGGKLTVVGAIDGASAAGEGLLPGDAILAIDGASTHGLLIDEAAERMRGPVHSTVRLTVQRGVGGSLEDAVARPRHADDQIGALARRRRRHRLYPHRPVHRGDRGQPQGSHAPARRRRPAGRQRLHPRPAQRSRRLCRAGDRDRQRLHRQRRNRFDARPRAG